MAENGTGCFRVKIGKLRKYNILLKFYTSNSFSPAYLWTTHDK